MFPKDNISGNTKMMKDIIITPMPLLIFAIAKETTKFGSRLKFVVLIRPKKNEIGKTERAQVLTVRR